MYISGLRIYAIYFHKTKYNDIKNYRNIYEYKLREVYTVRVYSYINFKVKNQRKTKFIINLKTEGKKTWR